MKSLAVAATILLLLAGAPLRAQDVAGVCGASSRYDLSVSPQALTFDSTGAAPRHVVLAQGRLSLDGRPIALGAEQHDRAVLFETELRALLPRVRALASKAVEVALAGLRSEAAGLDLDSATRRELEQRLATHAAQLQRRIAGSTRTRDWQGDALARTTDALVADVTPLLAASLAQQAVQDALAGDLDAAASLHERAEALATELEPRLERRLETLRPEVQALCPAIARLAELQRGLRDAAGRPLDLVDFASPRRSPRRR